jgi:hypothetical protein
VEERRFWTHVRRLLEAQWMDAAGAKVLARVSDLSFGGCYLNTLVTQCPRSRCQLLLFVPNEGVTAVNAEVVHVDPQVGCGVRFVDPSPEPADALARTVFAFPAKP